MSCVLYILLQLEVYFGGKILITKPAIIGTMPLREPAFQSPVVPTAPELPVGPEGLSVELPDMGPPTGNIHLPSYEEGILFSDLLCKVIT